MDQGMDSDFLKVGRERLSRVFRFLEALNQHRNPPKLQIREQPWTLWLPGLPDHPAIRRGVARTNSHSASEPSDQPGVREEDSFVLKVSRAKLTRPPEPPAAIKSWLEIGWDDPSKNASVRRSRNESGPNGEAILLRFEDDPKRVSTYDQWKLTRGEWAQNERPARAAMKVFENLYELHGRIEREAERVELVLGDGILNWRWPEDGVDHPVLLQRLQLG